MRSCSTLFVLCFASVVYAAIGPRANVYIENKVIAPDGFSRSYVSVNSYGKPIELSYYFTQNCTGRSLAGLSNFSRACYFWKEGQD